MQCNPLWAKTQTGSPNFASIINKQYSVLLLSTKREKIVWCVINSIGKAKMENHHENVDTGRTNICLFLILLYYSYLLVLFLFICDNCLLMHIIILSPLTNLFFLIFDRIFFRSWQNDIGQKPETVVTSCCSNSLCMWVA